MRVLTMYPLLKSYATIMFVLLTGCGVSLNPFQIPASSTSTQTALTTGRTYVYMTDYSGDSVAGYKQNNYDGSLSLIPGGSSVLPSGTNPFAITIDGLKRFLYLDEDNAHQIHGFAINQSTGALSAITGGDVGNSESAICSDPLGRFIYSNRYSAGQIYGYSINQTNGALTALPGSPYTTAGGAHGCVVDSTGRFLYNISAVRTTPSPSPDTTSTFSGYSIASNGSLTSLTNSPYQTGGSPYTIAIDPGSKFLYMNSNTDDTITVYSLDPTTGVPTRVGSPISPVGGASQPVIQLSATGEYMFFSTNYNITVYRINRTTGTLAVVSGYPTSVSNSGYGIFTPDANILYLTTGAPSLLTLLFNSSQASLTQGTNNSLGGIVGYSGGASVHFSN